MGRITIQAAESNRHYKVVRENQEKQLFQLRHQEEEDFWDEYKEANSASSSEDESGLDEPSSEEKNLEEEGDRSRDDTCEGLGDNEDGGVQLDTENGAQMQVDIFEELGAAVCRQ